jgi:hypothetical protein
LTVPGRGEVTFLGDNLSLDEFGKSLRRVGRPEWFVFFFEIGGGCAVMPRQTRFRGEAPIG